MKCLICGKESEGSVGAAGIAWKCFCQECKDKEDKALAAKLTSQAAMFNAIANITKLENRETKVIDSVASLINLVARLQGRIADLECKADDHAVMIEDIRKHLGGKKLYDSGIKTDGGDWNV